MAEERGKLGCITLDVMVLYLVQAGDEKEDEVSLRGGRTMSTTGHQRGGGDLLTSHLETHLKNIGYTC